MFHQEARVGRRAPQAVHLRRDLLHRSNDGADLQRERLSFGGVCRKYQVPGEGVLPGDLQRGNTRPLGQRHQAEIRAERAPGARGVRPGPVHAHGPQRGRVRDCDGAWLAEPRRGLHLDEQGLVSLALHLQHPPGDVSHRRSRPGSPPSREAQPGGPGGKRASVQNGCDGRATARGHQDQPVALGPGGRPLQIRPLPGLQADPVAAGLAGRQHSHPDGGLPLAGRQQLRGEPEHAALRQPRQEHPEPAAHQRGSQGRAAARVPGGDQEAAGSRRLCCCPSLLQRLEQEVVGGERARNQEFRQRRKAADQRKARLVEAAQCPRLRSGGGPCQRPDVAQGPGKAESGQTGDPRPADGVRGGEEGLPGRDCNYSSPERLKREAVWDEESAAWRIPDVTVQRTSLPSGGTSRGGCAEVVLHPSILCSRAGSIFHTIFDIISLSRRYCVPRFLTRPRCPPPSAVASKPRQARGPPADPEALAQVEEDGYKELLERSDSENIANAYFRFKRASQLLGGQTATGCAAPERVAPPKRRCEPGLRHATSLSPRILDSACIQWQGEEEKNQISSIMEASDRSGTTSCMLAPQWRALKNGPPKKL
ncbi:kinesin-like protein KIF17 isoform X16 [Phyllopteryx taeniolatus]|uniref:kinesin-like protein KIF17 isoform X16 n=1 Tax=Phyllopteryx taeniolatus TaxID=161469 RepID=UPI002AD448B3|nr:kinesin-like protein KIF17 isoform X16 [Phyllopteryx taeniolatus]